MKYFKEKLCEIWLRDMEVYVDADREEEADVIANAITDLMLNHLADVLPKV